MENEKKRKILYFENKKKEKNFPKNPNNISGEELKEHFDLNNDGKVTIKEYAEHIKFHCNNPETLDRELRKSFEKGGEIEDLFENYEKLPSKPKRIINYYMQKYEDGNYDYQDSKEFLEKMEAEGYTFDYYLDNEPYGLRKTDKGVRTPDIEYKKGGELTYEDKSDEEKIRDIKSEIDSLYYQKELEFSEKARNVKKIRNRKGSFEQMQKDLEQENAYYAKSYKEYNDKIKKLKKELLDKYDKRYEKGGALSKEFKFDKNFVIYVPSTSNVGEQISKEELEKRVDEVVMFAADEFGGYTETETDGGYKSQSGEIVEEDIIKVSVFAKNKDWKENENKVISKVKQWAKDWGQEAIGFEYEGDLYYIDDEGKFSKGGLVHAYDDDGSLYGTGTIEKVEGKKTLVRFDGSTVKEFDSDKVKPVMMTGGTIRRRTRVLEYPYTSHLVIRDAVKDLKEFQDYEYGANRAGYATIEIDAKHLDRIYSNLAQYGGEAELIDEKVYYKKGGLTPKKAKKILKDGTAQGKPLTDKQKRYFGYVASQEDEISERVRRKRMEMGGKVTLKDYLDKKEKMNPKPKTYVETFIDEDTGEEVPMEITKNPDDFLIKDSPSKERRGRKAAMKRKKLFFKLLDKKNDIMYLEDELKQIDMLIEDKFMEQEQTAEPEGGSIASRIGEELEQLERRKLAIQKVLSEKKKELKVLDTNYEKVEEDFYDRYKDVI